MKKLLLMIWMFFILGFNFLNANNMKDAKYVYLFGENHRSSDDTNFREIILKLAVERKLVYAMEGIAREELIKEYLGTGKSPAIYGVEDPVVNIFRNTLELNAQLRFLTKSWRLLDSYSQDRLQGKKSEILGQLVSELNQEFLQGFWDNQELVGNLIFEFLKKNKSRLMKMPCLELRDFLNPYIAFASWSDFILKPYTGIWSDAEWANITKIVTLELTPIIVKRLSSDKVETLAFLLTCLDDFDLGSNCDPAEKFFKDALHLDLRNDFIINNLEQIYSLAKNKPVVCILGHAHIKGVKTGLKERGFVVLEKKDLFKTNNKSEL